jgi:hypothetical protein
LSYRHTLMCVYRKRMPPFPAKVMCVYRTSMPPLPAKVMCVYRKRMPPLPVKVMCVYRTRMPPLPAGHPFPIDTHYFSLKWGILVLSTHITLAGSGRSILVL